MQFYILDNQLVITTKDGTVHNIFSHDNRFNQLKENLLSGNFSPVEKSLATETFLGEGISLKDNLISYKNTIFPLKVSMLASDLLKKKKDLLVKNILDFYMGMSEDINNPELIAKLLEGSAYYPTPDKGIIFYSLELQNDLFHEINKEKIKFKNTINFPDIIKTYFDNQTPIKDIIHQCFGFHSKNILKSALSDLDSIDKILIKGYTLNGLLSQNNMEMALNLPTLKNLTLNTAIDLRDFLKALSTTKDNKVSEKKVINFLQKSTPEEIHDISTYYGQLKNQIDFSVKKFKTSNNKDLILELKTEAKKVSVKSFNLNIDILNKKVFDLDGFTFDQFTVKVPKTNHDLIEWGVQMHNCIGSFGDRIAKGKTTCFALFSGGKIFATIEVSNKKVVQFELVGKIAPHKEHIEALSKVLLEKNIISLF